LNTKILYLCVSRGKITPEANLKTTDVEDALVTISSQSGYAPSASNTHHFITEAFSVQSTGATRYSLFVAVHEAEPLGYLEMRITLDDAEIDFVAVDTAFQRMGIGKRLVSNSVQHAISQGAKRILLEVGELNAAAIALYKELGFSQISMRKNYYKNGENALVMARQLSPASASCSATAPKNQ
jgi:ribosomal-protein-alanine N-acetyltransferase